MKPRLFLKTDSNGEPQRIILRCEYEDSYAAKYIAGGVGRFGKTDKGFSFPLDPIVVRDAMSVYADLQVDPPLMDFIQNKYEHHKKVVASTTLNEPFEPDDNLWDFQRGSIRYLLTAKRCLLTHRMGTGKTVISSRAIKYMEPSRVLIVCPETAKFVWAEHLVKWGGWDKPNVLQSGSTAKVTNFDGSLIYQGNKGIRDKVIPKILSKEPSLLIINFDQLRMHIKQFSDIDYNLMIVDEAHRISNRKTVQAQAAARVAAMAENVWLLTGTPIRNDHMDLWMLLHICDPHRFSSYWNYMKMHTNYVPRPFGGYKVMGPRDRESYGRMLATYVYGKTKEEVLPDLPEKIYHDIPIPMHPEQEKLYKQMEDEFCVFVREEVSNGEEIERVLQAPTVLAKLTRLRQICLSPKLIGSDVPSAKLLALPELIEDLVHNHEKALFFTCFAKFIPLVRKVLSSYKISSAPIVGGQSSEERRNVEKWLNGSLIQAIVGTIQSMGESLNLQAAKNVFFLDQFWVPAINQQAEDRVHRGNIKTSPHIFRIYHPGTVDQDVRSICKLKEGITNEVRAALELARSILLRKEATK